MNVASFRTVKFIYAKFTASDLRDVEVQIERGESIALLGSPGIGKRYLLSHAQKSVISKGWKSIRINCENFSNESDSKVTDFLYSEIERSCEPNSSPTIHVESTQALWIDLLRDQLRNAKRPTRYVFFISNLDAISSGQTRSILQGLRELCDYCHNTLSRVSIVVSGAFDLAPFVHGHNSEFDIPTQYVVQGLGKDLISEFFTESDGGIDSSMAYGCVDIMDEQTNGNLLLQRVIFESVLECRRRTRRGISGEISVDEIKSTVDSISSSRSAFCDVFLRSFFRVEESVKSLKLISKLIEHGHVDVNEVDPKIPCDLELTGIAIRSLSEGKLKWASPLVQTLATRHFNDWTLGDSFAASSEWSLAIQHYRQAYKKKLPFSIGANTRPRFSSALRSFETGLFQAAGTFGIEIDRLCKNFRSGAMRLLGFSEVTFWSFDHVQSDWQLVGRLSHLKCDSSRYKERLRALTIAKLKSLLRTSVHMESSVLPPDPVLGDFFVVAKLPTSEDSPSLCVALSNFGNNSPMSRERRLAARDTLARFCDTYRIASTNRQRNQRDQYHSLLIEKVTPKLFQLWSGNPEKTKQVLEAAGETLRENRYRRVMFSMVDRHTNRIRGVVDCREPAQQDIAAMTDYSLDLPVDENGTTLYLDIQQQCVLEACPIAIPDAALHPLTCPQVVRVAKQRAVVLFPLIYKETVLGTMHIERTDMQLPDSVEMRSLRLFSEQLAASMFSMMETDTMERSLHQQREVVLLCDRDLQVHFANRMAADKFGLELGWLENYADLKKVADEDTIQAIKGTISTGTKHTVSKLGADTLQVIEAEAIEDWSGGINCYLIQIHYLDPLAKLLHAIQNFAKCQDLASLSSEILKSLEELGFKSARVYRLDKEETTNRNLSNESTLMQNDECLVGIGQFGCPDNSPAAIAFGQGNARLSRKDRLGCWRAIDERMPILFAINSEYPFEKEFVSSSGLRFFNTEATNCPEYLSKPIGAKWIDIPLLRSDQFRTPLGKISIECPDDFSHEMLKYLEILAEAASACVTSLQVQEIRSKIETAAGRKLMLTVIGNTAHQLRSKLNSVLLQAQVLSTVMGKDHPERLELVTRIENVQGVLEEMEDRFAPITLQRKTTDFVEFARTLLLRHSKPENLYLDAPAFLQVSFDPKLIEEAIEELIENGRKAVFNKRQLQLRVSISSHSFKSRLWCRFEIEDNGAGFPKEYRDSPIQEYRSQWPEYERGHGLGLSRVSMIVAEHGGVFQNIRSHWGGARFRIDLPRSGEDSSQEQQS